MTILAQALAKYAALVVDAAKGNEGDLVLVAQSMGGFTAPLVAERIAIQRLVMVNAMIPAPGEAASAWGKNTGSQAARAAAARRGGYAAEFDLATYFLHDLPRDIAEAILAHDRDEAPIAFEEPCAFTAWPEVPLHVIVGRDDRLFPAEFQARVARERLGREVDELPGGHLIALSNPQGLSERLLGYLGA